MNKIIKIFPALVLVGAFIDSNFDLLKQIGLTDTAANWIKLLGLLTTSILPSVLGVEKHMEASKYKRNTNPEDTVNPDNPQFPKDKY